MTTTYSEVKPGTAFLTQGLGMGLPRTAWPLYLRDLSEGPWVGFPAFSNSQDGNYPWTLGTPG